MDSIVMFAQSKAGLVLAALAVLLVAERVYPMATAIGGARRVLRNLSLAAINAGLSWAVVVPVSALAAQWALGWRPLWWSGWPGLAFDVLLLDLWIYWWHRANHAVPVLWRFHEVHHLDQFLDASSALRFHFGEVLLSALVRAGVIFAAAIPLANVVAFETILAFITMFHHSNLRLPMWLERPLSLLLVTPSIHWVHHHAQWGDTDSSYATVLSLWDRLFSSHSATVRTAAMEIGVEGTRERTLAGLIKRPFTG